MRIVQLSSSSLLSSTEPIRLALHGEGDYISDLIFSSKSFYEEYALLRFARLLFKYRREGAFIDVGCNIGNHSSMLSRIIGFTSIFLVDPVKENIRLARFNNLQAFSFLSAASSQPGNVSVYVYQDNYGACTLKNLWDPVYGEGHDPKWGGKLRVDIVPAITLDLITENPVMAIKIDVEGAELRVLKGACKLLKLFKPILWIEMHSDDILKRSFEYTRTDINNFLDSFGYRSVWSDGFNFFYV